MAQHKRPVWIVFGWISVALAVIGVFLPIVPQVPFAILAAFCFSKGSPRLHRWVLNNKHFGAAVRDWELDRVIRPRMKRASIAMMIGGAGLACWKFGKSAPGIAVTAAVLFAAACVFVATRRSKTRPEPAPRSEGRVTLGA